MQAIKVRRKGIVGSAARKPPFRAWLDEQPRKALTYKKDLPNRDALGWRNEDFVMEAIHRGLDIRWGTVLKWVTGTVPRYMSMTPLKETFPTIQF